MSHGGVYLPDGASWGCLLEVLELDSGEFESALRDRKAEKFECERERPWLLALARDALSGS